MGENNIKKFRYNDVNERYIKTNRFVMIGIQVLYVMCLIYLLMKMGMKSINVKLSISCIILMIIFASVTSAIYLKEKNSKKFKYLITTQLIFIFALLGFFSETAFIQVAFVGVLVICVLYYDSKFTHQTAVCFGITYAVIWGFRVSNGIIEQNVNEFFDLIIYLLVIYVVSRTGDLVNLFNADSVGMVEEQKRKQQDIMNDILDISKNVQDNVVEGSDAISKLFDSSKLVSQSMTDISDATNETALNVNAQTEMTQNIQQAIEKTVADSERMVSVANESNEDIAESLKIIANLKSQSESIGKTNDQVKDAMEKLQEKTKEVQSIAQIIFDISSQTNLLALNASIESARAGEAGRGFAVVADQIRQLAEETRKSTESISQLLEELNRDAQTAVTSIETSVGAADEQDEMIHTAYDRFNKLGKNIKIVIENTNTITDSIGHLSDENAKLVENISKLSAATEEITSNAEQTNEVSNSNYSNAKKASEKLSIIRENTDRFSKYIE